MLKTTAIIAAGGAGLRMGSPIPKQFGDLRGIPILIHTVRALGQVMAIHQIIVVAPAEHQERTNNLLARFACTERCTVVAGGRLRQDSVRIGLSLVDVQSALVMVHDGARPLICPQEIERCLKAAAEHGAAILAIPVQDTLKAVEQSGTIHHTVPREGLWQAQTPQVFRREILQQAFAAADRDGFVGTDEASLLEHAGIPVQVVEGLKNNNKITRLPDLALAEALLAEKQPAPATALRIGHGFDAHRLVSGRPLMLGGVCVPHERGLLGHSDADVLCHALCDAILGAMGAGDIGRHFPDSDPRYRGISSITLLEEVMALATENNFTLINADVTVVAQRPRLAPHFPAMGTILAKACRVDPETINLKASTTEEMGYTGREEGISAHAVVLLSKN